MGNEKLNPENRTLAVVIGAVGPYHLARLAALNEFLRDRSWKLILVLRNGCISEYPWFEDPQKIPYSIARAYSADDPEPSAMKSARQLWCALNDLKPDAVVFGMPSRAYLSVLGWAVRFGKRAILLSESKADDSKRGFLKESFKRLIYRNFHGAVVGGAAHSCYAQSLGVPADRCALGYDVVDNAHFESQARDARANIRELQARYKLPTDYFVAANRFVQKKNLPRLLEAYGRYRQETGSSSWDLVMLGDGPDREALVAQCHRLDLVQHVHFKGLANYDDLPAYYGLARAFIHASTVEQWGLVVNEAMAAGLPVLLSRTCGSRPSLLEEDRNGYSFDPFSISDMASTLRKFHALDDETRRTMGVRSEEIISKWGPRRFAEAIWASLHEEGVKR